METERRITVLIQGSVYPFAVSKYTTCDDVITMARRSVSSLEDNHSYAVFESAFGVFKLLPGNAKVLKQIRSWGISKHSFAIEIRKLDEVNSKKASVSRAKKTLNRLRTLISKQELKADQKLQTYLDNIDSVVDKKYSHCVKNITVVEKSFETGKREPFKLPTYANNPIRTPGDGSENVSFMGTERSPGVGEESADDFCYIEDSSCLNNGFISDHFESGSCNNKDELNECAIYENDDMSLVDEESVFGEVTDCDSICELERNVIDPNGENSVLNLNDCIIYEDDDISSADDESAFEDDSDCESLFELERNVLGGNADDTTLKLNQIKAMFSKGHLNARLSDDDLMNSFMHTFINDESDEGMESDCSDLM